MKARCAAPVGLERLSAYWLGDLPHDDMEQVEEHILGCSACAGELQWLASLGTQVRGLLKQGVLRVGVSEAFLARAVRDGIRIREYRVPPGGTVQCTITPDDDLVVGRLQAELAGLARVDVAYQVGDGPELRIPDVPVHVGREVIFTERSDLLRSLGDGVTRIRLIAVDPGRERVLGDYTFDHHVT